MGHSCMSLWKGHPSPGPFPLAGVVLKGFHLTALQLYVVVTAPVDDLALFIGIDKNKIHGLPVTELTSREM